MQSIRSSLARWRAARRAVLGVIFVSGTMATALAVGQRIASTDCSAYQHIARAYTYSGVGVVIERDGTDSVMVRRVIPGSPADGNLVAGTRLLAVDGETPVSLEQWAGSIRGETDTDVELQVMYPCGGQDTVTLTRGIIRVEY